MASEKPTLSVVVPVFNEQAAVPIFLETVLPILERTGCSFELIFVDDGSHDETAETVRSAARSDRRICLVELTRNFGKEAALTAGLDWARGDAVIPIDVDLQDPPELILDFVAQWRNGFDIVFGQRVDRQADSLFKRLTAGLFYRAFNRIAMQSIEDNAGDFRLMSRPAVDATLRLRERNRFMKGIFAWVGFKSVAVPFTRPKRSAGETKYNFWKLWNFAIDGITSFSTLPLRVWTYVGMLVAASAGLYTFVLVLRTLIFGRDVPGYASLMVVTLTLGAVQLISLGIVGEYLGRLYIESKQRPIYLVRSLVGLGEGTTEESGAPWTGAEISAGGAKDAAE